MQHLRLYENFTSGQNPEFAILLSEISPFFKPKSPKLGFNHYLNPEKYSSRNSLFGHSAVALKGPQATFTEIMKLVMKKGYDFKSFPGFNKSKKDIDFERIFDVSRKIEFELGQKLIDSQYAIALPTTHNGMDCFFTIAMTDSYSSLRLIKPNDDYLLCDESQNYDSGFQGIIWTDRNLVYGDFKFESYEYYGRSLEDGTGATYVSKQTSNGKKYEIEVGTYMIYKDEIDEIEDMIRLRVL